MSNIDTELTFQSDLEEFGLPLEIDRQLSELKTLYRMTIDSMDRAYYRFTLDGTLVSVNRIGVQMVGTGPEAIVGKSVFEYLSEDEAVSLTERMEGLKTKRERAVYEDVIRDLDGEKCFRSVFQLIENAGGEPVHIQLTVEDITHLFEAESKLTAALGTLTGANEELSLFAGIFSHDFQATLRVITSYLQLSRKMYQERMEEDAQAYIELAVEEVKKMTAQMLGFGVYARLEINEGAFDLIDSGQIVDRAIEILERDIEKAGASVTRTALPSIMGEHDAVLLLFRHLIENAVKYRGKAPPRISISAELSKREWRFAVEDNGIGIEEKYYDRVFDVFQRLHKNNEYEGIGIGLAVCKKIVNQLGGRIWVHSKRNVGSIFYFTVPKADVSNEA